MTTTHPDDPIDPTDIYVSPNRITHQRPGLTKREHFAAMAHAAILANSTVSEHIAEQKKLLPPDQQEEFDKLLMNGLAACAVLNADALIAALNQPKA